jgi:hypothetical protein
LTCTVKKPLQEHIFVHKKRKRIWRIEGFGIGLPMEQGCKRLKGGAIICRQKAILSYCWRIRLTHKTTTIVQFGTVSDLQRHCDMGSLENWGRG